MKEFIAQPGGRYTYVDDVLNLQEMASSMTSIFAACSNFIISGCEMDQGTLSPGFVWINGRVRYFDGANHISFPYYIYEKNEYESTTYANEVNQRGRCNYLCVGASEVPQTSDAVTGDLPQFILLTEEYAPRFLDKFFGKYAVLLENPFSKQTVKGELSLSGSFHSERNITSKGYIGIIDSVDTFRASLSGGIGMMSLIIDNKATSEVWFSKDSISFGFDGIICGTVSKDGLNIPKARFTTLEIGSLILSGNSISVKGYDVLKINDGTGSFKGFQIYVGGTSPVVEIMDSTEFVYFNRETHFRQSDGIALISSQTQAQGVTSLIKYYSSNSVLLGQIGFAGDNEFTLLNRVGNILLHPKESVDIQGQLKLNGKEIQTIYVDRIQHYQDLSLKVDKIDGKQLSDENFSATLKKKLDDITQSSLGEGTGFVSAKEVNDALATKMSIAANLGDVRDKATARKNLEMYSRTESDGRYLLGLNYLSEIIYISAEDARDLDAEQIIALRNQRAALARKNIMAEKEGSAELRLAKSSNLADISDVTTARSNLNVYSKNEIDDFLGGKLSVADGYEGVVFTSADKDKLDGIKTGTFAGKTAQGTTQSQVEGYVTTSAVLEQLNLKANRLLDGYSTADKGTIATNLGIYTKSETDARYGQLSSSFQDYITYLVGRGSTTTNAQKTLRDKIDAPAKSDLNNYLQKGSRLTDLTLGSETAKKAVCTTLGAAYAADYQTKLIDTGWVSCGGSNSGTVHARQIGNIVSIQGMVNTGRYTGSHWGGIAFTIPNSISPPKFACRNALCEWNDGHKYNRGITYVIPAGSRNVIQYESGWSNTTTEINFTYMT